MIIIEKEIPKQFTVPQKYLSAINQKDFMLFDIETTGLSHSKSKVVLIGLITYNSGILKFHQYFAENLTEEKLILMDTLKFFKDYEIYVSFNGNSFDIPYLNARLKHHNIDFQITKHYSFDLLRFSRKHMSKLNLENSKLKTIEKYLGISREDTISGKESVDLYFEYLRTNSQVLLGKILLHNEEDIIHMIPLLKITEPLNKKILVNMLPSTLKFTKDLEYGITTVKISKDYVHIDLDAIKYSNNAFYRHFEATNIHYNLDTLSINSEAMTLSIILPIFRLKPKEDLSFVFIDINTISIFNSTFNLLDNGEKEDLIIQLNSTMNYANIVFFLKELFSKLKY